MDALQNLMSSTDLQCCSKSFAGNQYQFKNTSFLKLKFPANGFFTETSRVGINKMKSIKCALK